MASVRMMCKCCSQYAVKRGQRYCVRCHRGVVLLLEDVQGEGREGGS